jgi:predicted glutamine amidotransferase
MCVIAIKKPGINVPDDQNIKNMWETNSDGAGFMYTFKNKVYIEKGFMKLDDLMNAMKHVSKRLKVDNLELKDIPIIYHFRIKTHGANNPANTHPFPISSKEQHLKALDLMADIGVAHNGIISSALSFGDMSDTASYIAHVLTPLAMLDKDFYKKPYGKTIMENTIGSSKLAFLDKDGNIETIGDFKNGTKAGTTDLLYSNLNHEYDWSSYKSSPYGTYSYGYGAAKNKGNYYDSAEFEILKPIPKDFNVSYFSKTTNKEQLFKTQSGDTYFMDDYGFIYVKNKTTNIYTETSFTNVYNKKGKKVLFKNLPTKSIQCEVMPSYTKGYNDLW